ALALGVGSRSAETARLALDEAGRFDAMRQAVGHDRIVPVDERFQPVFLPQQIAGGALLGRLEDKPQPRIIPLVLDTGDAPASAAYAHPSCLTRAHPVEGTIGAWPGSAPARHPRGQQSRCSSSLWPRHAARTRQTRTAAAAPQRRVSAPVS